MNTDAQRGDFDAPPPAAEPTQDADLGYTVAALADDFLAWWVDREDNDGEQVEQDEAYDWWVAKAREIGAKL